jgi:hypothetical protein
VENRVVQPEHSRRDREVVRAVTHGLACPDPATEPDERQRPAGKRRGLPGDAAAAVPSDDGVRHPVELEEAERLREVARRDDRLDAGLGEPVKYRPEEEDVRRVREVDPDRAGSLHGLPPSRTHGLLPS